MADLFANMQTTSERSSTYLQELTHVYYILADSIGNPYVLALPFAIGAADHLGFPLALARLQAFASAGRALSCSMAHLIALMLATGQEILAL